MKSTNPASRFDECAGLLVDTNLLVLFVVGSVNCDRIENFKRTQKYGKRDYELLLRKLSGFTHLYTLAHVMAEVSNLTDLTGDERALARQVLKEMLSTLREPEMASLRAARSGTYDRLGLVDSAIATASREHGFAVLTDDLDLYLALSHEGLPAINFAHLQAREWG